MRDSIILAVTLPRPMGVVFEEQRPKQAVAVGESDRGDVFTLVDVA